ncbi:MAG: DUF4388 domain-containing protein, partial [Myxococcota bacterium]|nr:DUF4388 domain-containing protein [Myxococcota bacterium]
MGRPCILVVDDHPEDLRLLDVSLKNAGFAVTTASNGRDALRKVEISPPDLIISETALPELDGFALVRALRQNADWAGIPFLFLSEERSVEHKVRGLELGVADYLTKPVFVRELVARLRIILQRRERERLEGRSSKTRFAGSLDDIGLVDLIQTIDLSKKTGVLRLGHGPDTGIIYFQDGEVVDAEVGRHRAAAAVYRLLTWSQGFFDVDFRPVRRERMVHLSCQELLMEGMRRLDEWGRLVEQLPSLDTVFIVDAGELMERLDEIPDEANAIIRLTDGSATLTEIVDAAPFDDLDSLKIVTKLVFYGVLVDTGRRAAPAARADFSYAREVAVLPEPAIRPSASPAVADSQITARIAELVPDQVLGEQPPGPRRPEVAPEDALERAVGGAAAQAVSAEMEQPALPKTESSALEPPATAPAPPVPPPEPKPVPPPEPKPVP